MTDLPAIGSLWRHHWMSGQVVRVVEHSGPACMVASEGTPGHAFAFAAHPDRLYRNATDHHLHPRAQSMNETDANGQAPTMADLREDLKSALDNLRETGRDLGESIEGCPDGAELHRFEAPSPFDALFAAVPRGGRLIYEAPPEDFS